MHHPWGCNSREVAVACPAFQGQPRGGGLGAAVRRRRKLLRIALPAMEESTQNRAAGTSPDGQACVLGRKPDFYIPNTQHHRRGAQNPRAPLPNHTTSIPVFPAATTEEGAAQTAGRSRAGCSRQLPQHHRHHRPLPCDHSGAAASQWRCMKVFNFSLPPIFQIPKRDETKRL